MNKKKILIALAILTLIVNIISGIYALSITETKDGGISTGSINIDLTSYILNEDGTKEEYTNQYVLPGDTIPLKYQVENLGLDCYIRYKIETNIEDNLDTDIVTSGYDNSKYTYKNGYYYYNQILHSQDKLVLTDSIYIDKDISKEYEDKKIEYKVTVDAIQAKNFSVDLTADEPWHGENILATKEDIIEVNPNTSNTTIRYINGAENYINIPENFFNNFDMLPGSTTTKEIEFTKKLTKNNNYILSITNNSNDETAKYLYDQISLKIYTENGKTIFDGKLSDATNIAFDKYIKKGNEKIKFAFSLPSNLDNTYSNTILSTNWRFTLNDNSLINPFTGDKLSIFLSLYVFTALILCIIIILLNKNNRKEEEK